MSANISMTNLPMLFSPYQEEIEQAIARVVKEGVYIGGPVVDAFEKEWASFTGVQYAIGVGNGTDALAICLRALDIQQGDKVVTVSLSAGATATAIQMINAIPVWVDTEPSTMTMCPDALEEVLDLHFNTPNPIKGIIPVHLYGQPADMLKIMTLAEKYNCVVVEDCAQAHGGKIGLSQCGSFGHMAAFSFYPTKNLGCLGDGGAICTNDTRLAEKARAIAQYGWKKRNYSEIPGQNSRLDTIQAAILRVRLPYLMTENHRRRTTAHRYLTLLSTPKETSLPFEVPNCLPVYHQFVIRTPQRHQLMAHLSQQGIESQIHYPTPIHLQPAFFRTNTALSMSLQHTEKICLEVLSIPVHPALTDDEVDIVIQAVNDFFQ